MAYIFYATKALLLRGENIMKMLLSIMTVLFSFSIYCGGVHAGDGVNSFGALSEKLSKKMDFSFEGVPLNKVLEKISTDFDIKIQAYKPEEWVVDGKKATNLTEQPIKLTLKNVPGSVFLELLFQAANGNMKYCVADNILYYGKSLPNPKMITKSYSASKLYSLKANSKYLPKSEREPASINEAISRIAADMNSKLTTGRGLYTGQSEWGVLPNASCVYSEKQKSIKLIAPSSEHEYFQKLLSSFELAGVLALPSKLANVDYVAIDSCVNFIAGTKRQSFDDEILGSLYALNLSQDLKTEKYKNLNLMELTDKVKIGEYLKSEIKKTKLSVDIINDVCGKSEIQHMVLWDGRIGIMVSSYKSIAPILNNYLFLQIK